MISGASVTTTASPYFVRTSFILAQSSWIMGEWAAKNGSKRVVTLVNEWAPGTEAETAFKQRFTELGGQIGIDPHSLANPDFAPFLQRIRDINPDTAFIFPRHAGRHFCQAVRRARPCQFGDQDHRAGRPHR